jgi:hypothetical protein
MSKNDTNSDIELLLSRIESRFPESTSFKKGSLDSKIPSALKDWIELNEGILEFSFDFEANGERYFGGIELGDPKELRTEVEEWIGDTWIADDETERANWEAASPFARLANGDFLAFSKATSADAPVIYLAHDDASRILAPSFADFQREWKKLFYVGPEIWILEPFLDSETGYLRHDTEEGISLRKRFSEFGILS